MKKPINFYLLLIVSAPMGGCTTSTGVIPFGPDTYTITVQSELGGMTEAKKLALDESNLHCQSMGKQMMPVSTKGSTPLDAFGDPIPTYEIIFRCLSEDDPDLKSPASVEDDHIFI